MIFISTGKKIDKDKRCKECNGSGIHCCGNSFVFCLKCNGTGENNAIYKSKRTVAI